MDAAVELERKHGLWTVNGHVWDDVVASGFTLLEASPPRDSVEIWELVNKSGGWQHPLHIHLIDFKILDRNGRPPFAFERGPKDVAYLGENETVRVITRFDGHRQVHDALPQPRARGPRHDGPVRGPRPARRGRRSARLPAPRATRARQRPAVAAPHGDHCASFRPDSREPARGGSPSPRSAAGTHAVLIAQQASVWWGYGVLMAATAVVVRGDRVGLARPADDRGRLRGDRRCRGGHPALRRQPHLGAPVRPRPDRHGPLHRPAARPRPSASTHALTGRAEAVGPIDLGYLVTGVALVAILVGLLPEHRRRPAANALCCAGAALWALRWAGVLA